MGFRRVAGAAAAAAGGNRRKKSLKSSFSMGFRSYIRQFLGVILYFSVLQCHGDLLLGVVRFLASQPATGVAGAGGSSSSRRKEEETGGKSSQNHISFSMGFRSYIRQFLGAILMLFRPSLPWGFAAGSGSIFGVAAYGFQKLKSN